MKSIVCFYNNQFNVIKFQSIELIKEMISKLDFGGNLLFQVIIISKYENDEIPKSKYNHSAVMEELIVKMIKFLNRKWLKFEAAMVNEFIYII